MTCWEGSEAHCTDYYGVPRLGNIECRSKIVISTYAKILSPPFLKVQSFPLQGGLELSMFDARQKVTRPSTWCFFWPNMFTKLSAGQNPLQPIPDQECHRAFVVLTCHPKTPHKNGVPPGPGGAELISNLVTSRLRGLALNQKPRRAESHCGSHQASAFIEPGDEL